MQTTRPEILATFPGFGRGTAIFPLILVLFLAGCPADPDDPDEPEEEELTAFELEHGLGPYDEPYELDPEIDEEVAAEGERIFQINCESCHRMGRSFVGPDLSDVLERRTPTFVLNMIMNPEQMAREHPEGQRMLAEYPTVMPYQGIAEDQAEAILEYLRTEQQ